MIMGVNELLPFYLHNIGLSVWFVCPAGCFFKVELPEHRKVRAKWKAKDSTWKKRKMVWWRGWKCPRGSGHPEHMPRDCHPVCDTDVLDAWQTIERLTGEDNPWEAVKPADRRKLHSAQSVKDWRAALALAALLCIRHPETGKWVDKRTVDALQPRKR